MVKTQRSTLLEVGMPQMIDWKHGDPDGYEQKEKESLVNVDHSRFKTDVCCFISSSLSTEQYFLLDVSLCFIYYRNLNLIVILPAASEMVVPNQRVYVGVFLWYTYSIGYFVLSALGKFLKSWRLFVVVTALPYLALVPGFL